MTTKVKLKELVQEMDVMSDQMSVFLNRKSGEFVTLTDEELNAAEEDEPLVDYPEWQQKAIEVAADLLEHGEDYLALPSKFDIDNYGIMRSFCSSVGDKGLAEELHSAIRGRGTFRRFRDTVQRHGMLDDWNRFRDKALRDVAIEWCEGNGIGYEE